MVRCLPNGADEVNLLIDHKIVDSIEPCICTEGTVVIDSTGGFGLKAVSDLEADLPVVTGEFTLSTSCESHHGCCNDNDILFHNCM